ncbi:hypothetical protein [uncultured Porphyromonas sp.]|uniref:hypothetical protein n=1 Tax=uncultured Porphyromonas sp. TaxID=159274 RepID=UPI00259A0421|nr:hypothetical protein [uncultured Porphyromonas sp.]
MTPEKLEFARTFTDKEVMSSAISQLRARTINEYSATTDKNKRQELEKRQLLLEFEARAVLGDDDIAHSIQDKVINLYGPMLRRLNGVE